MRSPFTFCLIGSALTVASCGHPSVSPEPLSPVARPTMARVRSDSARAVELGQSPEPRIESSPQPEEEEGDGDGDDSVTPSTPSSSGSGALR